MKLSEHLENMYDHSTWTGYYKLLIGVKQLELENAELQERLLTIHNKAIDMDLALQQVESVLDKLHYGG